MLVGVKSISDDKFVRDGEADVVDWHFHHSTGGFLQQAADFQAPGAPGFEDAQKIVQRKSRIHDILHKEHICTGDIPIEILKDPHNAGTSRRFPIARYGHIFDLDGNGDFPGQIRKKKEGAL